MPFSLTEIFAYNLLGNSVREYLILLFILFAVALGLKTIEKVAVLRLHNLAKRTANQLDDLLADMLSCLGWPFYSVFGLWVASNFINISAGAQKYISFLILVILVYYATLILHKILVYFLEKLKKWDKLDAAAADLLGRFGKVTLWFVAVLVVLQNLGFNVTALLAGFGIGGIAIAFAFQNILTDIFAYFSIHLDKPFVAGDFIIVNDDLGVVERIGIKSTRIRTLWGEELIISNKELTEKRVHNYKQMQERRIHFNFGVTYQTSSEKVRKIPQIVRDIFNKLETTRLDRVHFKSFGDYSLVFEVAYYTLTSDYNRYMDIQQEINLALKEAFEKEGIEFAYPTQTILINK